MPYKVYKNCPKLLHRLWRALKVNWRRGKIAEPWRYTEGVHISKEERSENIDQFRLKLSLRVECKIFFSIVAKRLSNFLLSNKYIDTSVEGRHTGNPWLPGTNRRGNPAHQGGKRRQRRSGGGDLVALWLDRTCA